jgi:hypothetical protein
MDIFIIGFIYELICACCNEKYIGSTTKDLKTRFRYHCNDSKTKNSKLYRHMREVGVDKFKINLIEKVNVLTLDEVRMKETEYYYIMKPSLNEISPYSTEEDLKIQKSESAKKNYNENKEEILKKTAEYYKNNKLHIDECSKKYRIENRDIINQRSRTYHFNNKDVIREKRKIYRKKNDAEIKEKKRLYRLLNAEKIKQKKKEYYEKNKDKINKKNMQNYYKNKDEEKLNEIKETQ